MALEITPRTLLAEYLNKIDEGMTWTELPPFFPDPLSTKSLIQVELSIFNGDYKQEGIGRSRKDAKQEAAKKMLIKLAAEKPDVNTMLEANNFDQMMEKSYEKADKNVLQLLNALCLVNNLSVKFSLIKETGEPHNKLYTVRCETDTLTPVEATRKTMKSAKNACAKKVIEMIESKKQLKTNIPKNCKVPYDNKNELKEDIEAAKRILLSKAINPVSRMNVKLSKLHLLETDPDCRVIRVLNDVKQKKIMDHDTFCYHLDNASMTEIKPIIERLKEEAGITYNVHYQELPSANRMRPVPMYIAFVRYFCRDVSKSFSSIHVNQYECEKKAYVKLLKFLSDLRLNTSGQSAMLDNASSDED